MTKTIINRMVVFKKKVLMTIAVALSILVLLFIMVNYTYRESVDSCYAELDTQAARLKTDLFMQMRSDSEQMKTIANFASTISENEELRKIMNAIRRTDVKEQELLVVQEEMAVVFNSFQRSGLIDELEILLPGDILITPSGTYNVSEYISFEETVKQGVHVSGVRQGFINTKQKVIHNAVPVNSKGETVAVLMGIIDVNKLSNTYRDFLHDKNAHLHLVAGESGDFIINTAHNHYTNVSQIEIGNSDDKDFIMRMQKGLSGNVAYKTVSAEDYIFASYDAVDINDWRVIVAMPEKNVFAEGRKTIGLMVLLALVVIIIMTLYIAFLFSDERKRLNLTTASSVIRKLLLEFGQRTDSLKEAFVMITRTVNSSSSFFVDTDGEWYDYVKGDCRGMEFSLEERLKFAGCLLKYPDNSKREIFVKEIKYTDELKSSDPYLYDIMTACGINNVVYTTIWDKHNHASTIGVLNCKRVSHAITLLCDIAMCFAMTIDNRKYLDETETAAVTDSLTGLANRMAFNRDVSIIQSKKYDSIACVYIDVNELHSYNNKYGHIAGDKMLCTVADIINTTFSGEKVYRWGGDEFIAFSINIPEEKVVLKIEEIQQKTTDAGYHISVGYSFSSKKTDTELLLKDSEKKMYVAKAKYYQDKVKKTEESVNNTVSIKHVATGSTELDTLLSVVGKRYLGVYAVSLTKDMARRILVPDDKEKPIDETIVFSAAINEHIEKALNPDYNRAFTSFMNYDLIRSELNEGRIPKLSYKKLNGEEVMLSIYKLSSPDDSSADTLWIFEKVN